MRAYYNEIDNYAADWIENLIAAGAIPSGDVDRRSIADVQASDLDGYDQCHFFAGIGLWAIALGQAGWPEGRHVWTGSCPCQPHSRAGSKLGFGDKRDLWPHWNRLIQERRPDTVFGEQVSGRGGRTWLDRLSADLEDGDYAIGSADIPAAGVGAPQDRPRIYFVASRLGNAQGVDGQRGAGNGGAGTARGTGDEGIGEQDRGAGAHGRPDPDRRSFWSDADLVACRDGWWRAIEPGLRSVGPGDTFRRPILRAIGNSISPPQAAAFIRAFRRTEEEGAGNQAQGQPEAVG